MKGWMDEEKRKANRMVLSAYWLPLSKLMGEKEEL